MSLTYEFVGGPADGLEIDGGHFVVCRQVAATILVSVDGANIYELRQPPPPPLSGKRYVDFVRNQERPDTMHKTAFKIFQELEKVQDCGMFKILLNRDKYTDKLRSDYIPGISFHDRLFAIEEVGEIWLADDIEDFEIERV